MRTECDLHKLRSRLLWTSKSQVLQKIHKNWLCFFTCLGDRAIYFELVDSSDTAACLDAVHRFIARNGQPEKKISDNGTNFVGAANEFQAAFIELKKDKIIIEITEKGIKWSFIPPEAPHFGGSWERLVRSCKKAVYNVLNRQPMKEDSLYTSLWIVKQLMKKRPITEVRGDVEDLEALISNLFLVGL